MKLRVSYFAGLLWVHTQPAPTPRHPHHHHPQPHTSEHPTDRDCHAHCGPPSCLKVLGPQRAFNHRCLLNEVLFLPCQAASSDLPPASAGLFPVKRAPTHCCDEAPTGWQHTNGHYASLLVSGPLLASPCVLELSFHARTSCFQQFWLH